MPILHLSSLIWILPFLSKTIYHYAWTLPELAIRGITGVYPNTFQFWCAVNSATFFINESLIAQRDCYPAEPYIFHTSNISGCFGTKHHLWQRRGEIVMVGMAG